MNKRKFLYLLRLFTISLLAFDEGCAQDVNPGISLDGKFVFACYHYPGIDNVILVQSTERNWRKEVHERSIADPVFTPDSKALLYYKNGSTLCIVHLGTDIQDTIAGCLANLSADIYSGSNGSRLFYQVMSDSNKSLHIRDLATGLEKKIDYVEAWKTSEKGTTIAVQIRDPKNKEMQLKVFSLAAQQLSLPQLVWQSEKQNGIQLLKFVLNAEGTALAFMTGKDAEEQQTNNIWYYNNSTSEARLVANAKMKGIDSNLFISNGMLEFAGDQRTILFQITEKPLPKPEKEIEKVDIWSFRDARMQNYQLMDNNIRSFTAAGNTITDSIIILERGNEMLFNTSKTGYALVGHWDYDILNHSYYTFNEYNWNRKLQSDIYLVSLKDGSRKILKKDYQPYYSGYPYYKFSDNGNYVVYYNPAENSYCSYEISTCIDRNLTASSNTRWENGKEIDYGLRGYYFPAGIIGWSEGDDYFLVFDHFTNIWKIDPRGKIAPVNWTEEIRRDSNLALHVLNGVGRNQLLENTKLLLKDPSCNYSKIIASGSFNCFVFTKESSTQAPVCFYTKDFKTIKPLRSNILPSLKPVHVQTIYWKTASGKLTWGNLYYPLEFDSLKKYPVIVHYYEQVDVDNRFHAYYLVSKSSEPNFDQPDYMISHGYFYFVPNMLYEIGATAESIREAVVPGIKLLKAMPYIDNKHFGITGASFGAYETNILASMTNEFAAAAPNSGVSDAFRRYLTESHDPYQSSGMAVDETAQNRLGVTPWQRPDIYIKNSPIFYADKVATPMLIGIGRQDRRVEGEQGIEMFLALRRLGKPAWLLSYDNADHGLRGDWSKRAMQFFDHYLKGLPAPIWMTQGIPARMKGRISGLELDSLHDNKEPGLLLKNEIRTPEQQKLLEHRTTVDKEGRIVDVKPVPVLKKKK